MVNKIKKSKTISKKDWNPNLQNFEKNKNVQSGYLKDMFRTLL